MLALPIEVVVIKAKYLDVRLFLSQMPPFVSKPPLDRFKICVATNQVPAVGALRRSVATEKTLACRRPQREKSISGDDSGSKKEDSAGIPRRVLLKAIANQAPNSPLWLTDLQRFQCRIVDLTGNGKLFDRLKPANRLFRLWADQAIHVTVIIAELSQLLLHGNNGRRQIGW
jgi:hypothetical protein